MMFSPNTYDSATAHRDRLYRDAEPSPNIRQSATWLVKMTLTLTSVMLVIWGIAQMI